MEYIISNNNLQIIDSAFIKKSDMESYLKNIRAHYDSYDVFKRSIFSLKNEWLAHNLLYKLNIARERTKDTDFDYPQKWYYQVGYFILGMIGRVVL